jgi:hypothetical protein
MFKSPPAGRYVQRVSQVLAETDRFDDILKVHSTGELCRQYARQRQYGIDIRNIGAEIKLRAERRAGELLRTMPKNPGRLLRGSTMEPRDDLPTYEDLGIPKTTAHRWQQVARLPDALFEHYLTDTKAKHEEITSAAVLALLKASQRDAHQDGVIDVTPRPVEKHRPHDRRSRPQRWAEAVATLRELQEEYQAWLENLPESLQATPLAEKLEEVCALDLDQLDIDLPRGFGRD